MGRMFFVGILSFTMMLVWVVQTFLAGVLSRIYIDAVDDWLACIRFDFARRNAAVSTVCIHYLHPLSAFTSAFTLLHPPLQHSLSASTSACTSAFTICIHYLHPLPHSLSHPLLHPKRENNGRSSSLQTARVDCALRHPRVRPCSNRRSFDLCLRFSCLAWWLSRLAFEFFKLTDGSFYK